jgi:hypothetical protein
VSRTRKDSAKYGTVLEVVKRQDGTFDLFLNRKLDRRCIPDSGMSEELCLRFGFCGEEYDSFLQEVNRDGKKTVVLN